MTDKDTAFKARMDALKEAARLQCEKDIHEAQIAKTAYIRAIEDVKRLYIDSESDRNV